MTNYTDEYDTLYGSKYFSVTDLHGQQPRREIGKVEVVELKEKDGNTKKKFLVYFKDEDKPLVLNKTNAAKLSAMYGKDRSRWIGVTVELYAEMTSLGKEGVRLRPIPTAGKSSEDMNDAVPF
jgi:hypothetical protein